MDSSFLLSFFLSFKHKLIKHGGIYLDLDALPLKSFDDLRRVGAVKGALMGAEKIIDQQAAAFTKNRNHYIMVSHFHEHLKKRRNGLSKKNFDQIMNTYKNDHWKLWEEFQHDYGYNFLYEDKCRDAESNQFAESHEKFGWWEDYEYLCNAVMMSMPDSNFMKVWLDRYRYFNDTCWNCHSVWLPTHLAHHIIPDDIHMLEEYNPKSTFFSPVKRKTFLIEYTSIKAYTLCEILLTTVAYFVSFFFFLYQISSSTFGDNQGWHREDLEMLYGNGRYDFSNSYAMHMWFSSAKRMHGLEEKVKPGYFIDEVIQKRRKKRGGGGGGSGGGGGGSGSVEKGKRRKRKEEWSTYQQMIRSVIPENLLIEFG